MSFGQPIRVADFLPRYSQHRHQGIHALSAEIERRIQSLIVHLPHLERARIVEAVKRLYLDQLWAGNTVIREPVTPQACKLLLTQVIAQAVDLAFSENPRRASEFSHKLDCYERALKRLHLSDEVISHFPERKWMARQSLRPWACSGAGWRPF